MTIWNGCSFALLSVQNLLRLNLYALALHYIRTVITDCSSMRKIIPN